MDKLGFTWYPQDWWTSDTFFELDPTERYIYFECLSLMYRNGGYMKTQKTQFEERIKITVSDETWDKITQRFLKTDHGYTSLTINKRLKKAEISRQNGRKGGRPKKENNPENPEENLKEKEKEKRNLNTDEKLSDWDFWGNQIVNDQDAYWLDMKGRKISRDEMDKFLSVATRKAWSMETQNAFRKSLKGFVDNTNGERRKDQKNKGKI
jgi:hypothetical protein